MTRSGKPEGALVLRGDAVAGRLHRTTHGAVFEYDATFREGVHPPWDPGLAYRLPYTEARVETLGTNVHPFFAGLLPEGIRLEALVRRVKTSRDDLLSLLVAAGADCIGDVAVVLESAAARDVTPSVDVTALATVRFADLLEQSISGKHGPEPTLPGVQEKVSAAMISFPVRARARAGPRSFILKLNPPKMPRLVENEHFFLALARTAGLEVANAELVHDGEGASGLLVERFDRVTAKGGAVTKVHQEDACQFLDRYPGDKYVLTYAEIARGIAALASAPIVETAKYLRLVAFSYLVANGDLHAKNVSLRTEPSSGRVELTPAYDVLTTLPYGDRTMALSFDGRDDNLRRATMIAFGERHGVRRAATEAMLDELCEVTSAAISGLAEIGLEAKKTADLGRVMKKRCADLAAKGGA